MSLPPEPVAPARPRPELGELWTRIRRIEDRHGTRPRPAATEGPGGARGRALDRERVVRTGWPRLDRRLADPGEPAGGLARGCVHEWYGGALCGGPRSWLPPLSILAHLARRGVVPQDGPGDDGGAVLWVGRSLWPYPRAMAADLAVVPRERGRDGGELGPGEAVEHVRLVRLARSPGGPLLERSVLIDADDAAQRLWALDLALRTPGVAVVVGDGSGFNMAASRRLQLAAARGDALVLLARPPWEERELSAATTRWRVALEADAAEGPCWSVALRRSKGSARA